MKFLHILWLPLAELFRTKYRDDITNLWRLLEGHKGLKELLHKDYMKIT